MIPNVMPSSPVPGSSDISGIHATSTTPGTAAPHPRFCTPGATRAPCAAASSTPAPTTPHHFRRVRRIDLNERCAFPHSGHTPWGRLPVGLFSSPASPTTPSKSYQHFRHRHPARSYHNAHNNTKAPTPVNPHATPLHNKPMRPLTPLPTSIPDPANAPTSHASALFHAFQPTTPAPPSPSPPSSRPRTPAPPA